MNEDYYKKYIGKKAYCFVGMANHNGMHHSHAHTGVVKKVFTKKKMVTYKVECEDGKVRNFTDIYVPCV